MANVMIWITGPAGELISKMASLQGGGNGNHAQYNADLTNLVTYAFQNQSSCSVQTSLATVAYSTGTLTLDTVVATDTCEVNGIEYTCVNSGATGAQFNKGADDAETAENLAAVIQDDQGDFMTATASNGVVTLTAADFGLMGDGFSLLGSTNITASGAELTGGASPSWFTLSGSV